MNVLKRQNKLWEGSRMLLPEHREALLKHYKETSKKNVPQIDEQQREYMHYRMQEAMNQNERVTLTHFILYKYKQFVGFIDKIDYSSGMIYVSNETESKKILISTLIRLD